MPMTKYNQDYCWQDRTKSNLTHDFITTVIQVVSTGIFIPFPDLIKTMSNLIIAKKILLRKKKKIEVSLYE